MKNQKFINKSFQDSDPDPLPENWRNDVEKNILKHMKKLSVDNLYILLSYAHDLLEEQIREESKADMIRNGKNILKFESKQ